MREETREQPAPLRSGLTTGSCATATSLAAARLLLGGESNDAVSITLPKGKVVQMRLEFCRLTSQGAEAGTLKDAGDDPDVTHGALLYSQVRLLAEPVIRFVAGTGVGTVTRPGLVLAVEPMVNLGRADVDTLRDHWTVVTRDRAPSAHVEHTLAVTANGVEILTRDEEAAATSVAG